MGLLSADLAGDESRRWWSSEGEVRWIWFWRRILKMMSFRRWGAVDLVWLMDLEDDDPQKVRCAGSGSDWWIQKMTRGHLIWPWLMGPEDDQRMFDLILADGSRRWWPSEGVCAGSGENNGENAKSSCLGSNPGHEFLISFLWPMALDVNWLIQ